MEKRVVFLGVGNMGGALARAICRGLDPKLVTVADPVASRVETLVRETGCQGTADPRAAVAQADYVFLCVKPQILPRVLRELLPVLAGLETSPVLISIAAGVPLAAMGEILKEGGLSTPLARLMPNTPSAIGEGLLLLAPGLGVGPEQVAAIRMILAPCGTVESVDEPTLDLGGVLSGCAPAFAYLFIEGLADGGVAAGLPRDKAMRYAAQTVAGAAQMVLQSGLHPGVLKDAVCSPGGTTIAGVLALETGGLRATAAAAVLAAHRRTMELSGK